MAHYCAVRQRARRRFPPPFFTEKSLRKAGVSGSALRWEFPPPPFTGEVSGSAQALTDGGADRTVAATMTGSGFPSSGGRQGSELRNNHERRVIRRGRSDRR